MHQSSLTPHTLIIYSFVLLSFVLLPLHYSHAINNSQNPYGGMRFSSTLRASIETLPETSIANIPVPVSGISVGALSDTWGDARSSGRTHEGIDIVAKRGTLVMSPTDAVVKRIDFGTSNGGTLVYTANPGGEVFYFAHLDTVAENLTVGQLLARGDAIGTVGNSGNASNGPTHLHFGIYTPTGAVNPFPRITKDWTDIEAEPSAPTTTATSVAVPTKNLTLKDKGEDVRMLQNILISKNSGPEARLLAEKGATGYFGPLTQKALIEYQVAMHISPAKGYYGPKTRTSLSS